MAKVLKILDGIHIDSSRWYEDRDGHVRVPVVIATTGILTYTYIDDNGDRVDVREVKLPEEILSDETVFSAEGKPITDEHPKGQRMVDSTNFAQFTKGAFINPKVIGNSIHGEIVIYDRELQDSIKSGDQYQISPGFWSHTEFKKGTFDGEEYDAIQRDITINHIAIVKDGRAGDSVRIKLDSKDVEKIRNEVKKMQHKVDQHSDKEKIKDYENSRDQSEHEEEEEEKDRKDRGEEEEEEEKDGGHEEEEKEDQPTDDEMEKLRMENKILREELKKTESRDSRGLYLEARDFALQHVTDSQIDQYHDDIDYYKRQVVQAAGHEAKELGGAKLDGAYDIAKLVLERDNRVTAPDRQDTKDSKNEMDKALATSVELNNVFEGKRRVA